MKYYNYGLENGVLKMVTEGQQGDYPSTIIDTLQFCSAGGRVASIVKT